MRLAGRGGVCYNYHKDPFLNTVLEEGGYEKLFRQFNGLRELASRKDGARGLMFAPCMIAEYNAEIQVDATNRILENLP